MQNLRSRVPLLCVRGKGWKGILLQRVQGGRVESKEDVYLPSVRREVRAEVQDGWQVLFSRLQLRAVASPEGGKIANKMDSTDRRENPESVSQGKAHSPARGRQGRRKCRTESVPELREDVSEWSRQALFCRMQERVSQAKQAVRKEGSSGPRAPRAMQDRWPAIRLLGDTRFCV